MTVCTLALVSLAMAPGGPSVAPHAPLSEGRPSLEGSSQSGKGRKTPEELFAAWEALPAKLQTEAVDWFSAECDRSKEYRFQLERFVLDGWEGERFEHPEGGDTPVFDAAVHCPAQIIERHFVDPADPKVAGAFKRLAKGIPATEGVPAYRYDWAAGQVVSTGLAWDDPARVARNAALGLGPKTDLVEALVAAQLNDTPMAEHAVVFGHAYADRSGRAFREITLYDAWSSGAELEMPDVEVLGIIHSLDGDWKTWVAPVAPRHHKKLYARVSDHYQAYHRYRALREALARTFLRSTPELPRGYARASERLHGFWEEHSSRPADLAADLPSSKTWEDWLDKKAKTIEKQEAIVEGRRGRMAALRRSDAWARRTWTAILTEFGAFEAPKTDDGNR